MYRLPKHNCKNCGQCCGPVPINAEEQRHIQNYVDSHEVEVNNEHDFITCKFRVKNKCSIYPVRPMLCRLMGVVEGMECAYGNSAKIDGSKHLKRGCVGLLNDVIKTK